MPRLKDLLLYLAEPGLEDVWLMLDIKLDNNDEDIMRRIACTIAEVKPSTPWNQRVVLGCWTVSLVLDIAAEIPLLIIPQGNLSPAM